MFTAGSPSLPARRPITPVSELNTFRAEGFPMYSRFLESSHSNAVMASSMGPPQPFATSVHHSVRRYCNCGEKIVKAEALPRASPNCGEYATAVEEAGEEKTIAPSPPPVRDQAQVPRGNEKPEQLNQRTHVSTPPSLKARAPGRPLCTANTKEGRKIFVGAPGRWIVAEVHTPP